MLLSGDGEKGGGLWVARALLLFKTGVGESSVSLEYVFLQYVEVARPIEIVDDALGCVFER